jgi:hypothetical protein
MAGVSTDSLRETLHPAEYEARTILSGGEVIASPGVPRGT